MSRRDSVLAGADVCNSFSSRFFPWRLPQRGFFVIPHSYRSLHGIEVAVVVWRFWRRKNFGRGPGQDRTGIADSRQPDARSRPYLGEPHRNESRTSGDRSGAVLLLGRENEKRHGEAEKIGCSFSVSPRLCVQKGKPSNMQKAGRATSFCAAGPRQRFLASPGALRACGGDGDTGNAAAGDVSSI